MPHPGPVIVELPTGTFALICRHDVRLSARQAQAQSHGHGPWSSNFAINLITEGSGTYVDERQREYPLGPGTAFMRFPDQAHSSRLDPLPYRESWLVLTPSSYLHLRGLGLIDTLRPVLRPADPEAAAARFATLAALPQRRERILGLAEWATILPEIIALLAALHPGEAGRAQDPPWLGAARRLLAGNLQQDLRVEEVAARLGVEPQRFRKQFAAHVGLAPKAYRIRSRIDRARGELVMKSVGEVAAEVGFGDAKHFSRLFRRYVGVSPRGFQKLGRKRLP